MDPHTGIQTKDYGRTGLSLTRVGLGGEGVLRTHGRREEARSVIRAAIAAGITYYDCARVYADSERYYGSVWAEEPQARRRVFQASKSAGRDRKSARKDLEESLARLRVDYIDLWQIHDVRTEADLVQIADPGGALEAFEGARSEGKVRFIGVTGHHDPRILTRAVTEWPVDAVMMPVNPAEAVIGGFLTETLAAAKEKGLAVIGMKILGGGNYVVPDQGVTPELLIRFALEQDISVAIVGCSSPGEVDTLARLGAEGQTLTQQERNRLLAAFRPHAKRLAFYRGV
jgi:aryl-alcohol dehydrogenase-like predicted oxidoreductase